MSLPSDIALTTIADDSAIVAATHRNNYAAIQTAVNGVIDYLAVLPGSTTNYRKSSPTAVNTTTSPTDLLGITIAAGVMGTTGIIRLSMEGDCEFNSSGAFPRFQLVFGGVTLLDTGVIPTAVTGASTTRYGWTAEAKISNLSATGSQSCRLSFELAGIIGAASHATAFTTGEGVYGTLSYGDSSSYLKAVGTNPATSVDTTVACPLAFKVINGVSNATYETKMFSALAEIL